MMPGCTSPFIVEAKDEGEDLARSPEGSRPSLGEMWDPRAVLAPEGRPMSTYISGCQNIYPSLHFLNFEITAVQPGQAAQQDSMTS